MAGDWIPFLKALPRKPEVLRLVRLTGLARATVVLTLLEFWAWVDDETIDGKLAGLTADDLSRACPELSGQHPDKCPDFFRVLSEVGWLVSDERGLVVPNFERWMSHPAKERLLNSRRKRQSRLKASAGGPGVAPASRPCPEAAGHLSGKCANTGQDNTEQNKPSPTPPREGSEGVVDSRPQTPEPARRVRNVLPADRPDLTPAAKRVEEHYNRVVASKHMTDPTSSILTLLHHTRLTEADLVRAADGFAEHCRRENVEAKARQGARKFYSDDGGLYAKFLDYQPKPYVPPAAPEKTKKSLTDAERAELAARLKAGKAPPPQGGS